MATEPNYLLGQGQQYADYAEVARGHGKKKPAYSFASARKRMLPRFDAAAHAVQSLPESACPNDEAVGILTLHPEYLAKSSYPSKLIEESGFRSVGSKPVMRTPEKISNRRKKRSPLPAVDLFVAGSRQAFVDLASASHLWKEESDQASDLVKLEDFRYPLASEKIKPLRSRDSTPLMEMAIHTAGVPRVLEEFAAYLNSFGIDADIDNRIDVGDLAFVPVRAPREVLPQVAEFSFLRFAREMPRLRQLKPNGAWPRKRLTPFQLQLPTGPVVDPTIRVAVFDGGCPDVHDLRHWVDRYDEDVAGEMREFERHGLAVTSALLFGTLKSGVQAPVPYAKVDHYRVLDEDTSSDPQHELYPVLRRIVGVLEREQYDFVNLSIGPDIPIDDGDIHPWTAKLDPLLESGKTLASLAVGNTGEEDAAAQLNRIQPPADAVNALSIGACDNVGKKWNRAEYSSTGHGRCPGVVKPDALAFGGNHANPFWVIDFDDFDSSLAIWGTSFAAPFALRTAIGVRAALGPVLSPLAIKALLLHNCHRTRNHPMSEVGWGRIDADVASLITCPSGTANVIYEGQLLPKKYLRAEIPMPSGPVTGSVTIKATICTATTTDPEHPASYTKSGLEIFFRPDKNSIPEGKKNPAAKRFFSSKPGSLEIVLRRDAHKWETVRQQKRKMQGSILKAPVFDIHHNPRDGGKDVDGLSAIPYAMIISVIAPGAPDLYGDVVSRYKKLRPLQPRIKLTVRGKR